MWKKRKEKKERKEGRKEEREEERKKKEKKRTETRINESEDKDSVKSLWDTFKHTYIHIMGVPEGEEREQEIENLF